MKHFKSLLITRVLVLHSRDRQHKRRQYYDTVRELLRKGFKQSLHIQSRPDAQHNVLIGPADGTASSETAINRTANREMSIQHKCKSIPPITGTTAAEILQTRQR